MAKKPQHEEPVIGRPMRSDEESDQRITLRLTKAELAAYEAAAARHTVTTGRGVERPMKVSEWIRRCCEQGLKRRVSITVGAKLDPRPGDRGAGDHLGLAAETPQTQSNRRNDVVSSAPRARGERLEIAQRTPIPLPPEGNVG